MISREEALDLFRSDDLIGIGMEADAMRRKWHPEGIVSYIIDRNINYTNFCTEYCSFCAFYRPLGHAEGYILPKETIYAKIQETLDLGGTGLLMQGGCIRTSKSNGMKTCSAVSRSAFESICIAFPRRR